MAVIAEQVVKDHETGTEAGSATVATVYSVAGVLLERLSELRVRLTVGTALGGDTPKLDVYLQRPVAADPDPATDEDWEDFYAFPQVTTSAVDKVVSLPLPLPQDADGSLASVSRDQAVESLTADTALGGHWMGPIRIREKLATGGSISQAAVYSVEFVGR